MGKVVKGITIPDTVYLDAQRATAPLAIMSETEVEIDLVSPTVPIVFNMLRWPLPDPQQSMILKGKVEMADKKSALGDIVLSETGVGKITLEDAGTLVVGAADVFVVDSVSDSDKSNRLAVSIIDTVF